MADLELNGSIPLYNTLIKLFLDRNQLDDAKSIYDDLIKRNIEPSKKTFGILMHYAAKKKDIPQLIHYLDEMDRYGIEPDHATMTVVIIALCKTKNIDRAKELLEDLHSLYAFVNDDYKNTLLKKIERRIKK
jgi:pentatricopeptide repeat protein